MNMEDIKISDMIDIMEILQPEPPVTTEYTMRRTDSGIDRTYYKNQKAHMIFWFKGQSRGGGSGKAFTYTRRKGNLSTKRTYMRFANPYGLLWFSEVLGESRERLVEAMEAALEAGKISFNRRCGAFRNVISFERILELLDHPDGWLTDSAMEMLIEHDKKTGRPFISHDCDADVLRILRREGIDYNPPDVIG